MREILFRGKTEKGEWVQGDLLHPDLYGNGYAIEDFTKEKNNSCDVIPSTIGQYTGLTDKNGTKIFEGDIVNVNTNKDTLCHRYEGRNLVIRFDEYHRFVASGRLEYPLCNHYEREVIGNIHDNLELLKELGK